MRRDDEIVLELRRHLFIPLNATTRSDELEEWLLARLAQPHEILFVWCHFWADQMSRVENSELFIVRSLFLQSLHQLRSFSSPTSRWNPEAYMLLNMEDGDHSERLAHDDSTEETQQRLKNIPAFKEYTKTNAILSCLAGPNQAAIDAVNQISSHQRSFFYKILANPIYCQYATDIILLISHRTQLVIQSFERSRDDIIDDGNRHSPIPSRRENLLDDKTIRSLKLTDWQLQLLVNPRADMRSILTSCQWDVYFKQDICCSGDMAAEEMHLCRPGTPITMPDAAHGVQRLVRTLFGQLESDRYKTLRSDATNSQQCRGTRATRAPSVRATFAPAPNPISALKTLNKYERGRVPQTYSKRRSVGSDTINDNPFARMRSVGSGAVNNNPLARVKSVGSGAVSDNPFTRMRFTKRAASPHELESKRIKVTDVLKEDWLDDIKTELKATGSQLQKELCTQLRNEFREVLVAEFKSHVYGIKDSIQAVKECRLEHALGLQADYIQKVLDAIDRPIPRMAAVQNTVDATRADMSKITQARTKTLTGAQASVDREMPSKTPPTRSFS
ncbi:hypothetical protein F5B18DRAFT_302344 [Nemania serpens]|nr:hypothetical protein F5B18DRAFT_302344 [Nemania serpens]